MHFVVLGLLLVQPATIYSLNKQFEASISLFYSASLGALRSVLLKLGTGQGGNFHRNHRKW